MIIVKKDKLKEEEHLSELSVFMLLEERHRRLHGFSHFEFSFVPKKKAPVHHRTWDLVVREIDRKFEESRLGIISEDTPRPDIEEERCRTDFWDEQI